MATQDVPMQMHLDFTVSSLEELQRQAGAG